MEVHIAHCKIDVRKIAREHARTHTHTHARTCSPAASTCMKHLCLKALCATGAWGGAMALEQAVEEAVFVEHCPEVCCNFGIVCVQSADLLEQTQSHLPKLTQEFSSFLIIPMVKIHAEQKEYPHYLS